jgi:hypothetical protein
MEKYRIKKLKAVDNPVHGKYGYGDLEPYYEGIFIKKPTIGERFNLMPIMFHSPLNEPHLGGISTSPVIKIIDENTFETLNSVYRIDKIIEE